MTDTLPRIHIDDISYWIEKDYIKEEEEKEFTKSELINFTHWYINNISTGNLDDDFVKWLTQKTND